MARGTFFIVEVAKRAGARPTTIRYYETLGLLPAPRRGENRYRLYSEETVGLLQFIQKAQGLGLTLDEIKEIVDLRRNGQPPCARVRALLERRIADLDQRVRALIALRKKLTQLLAGSRVLARRGRTTKAAVCPWIEGVPETPERQTRTRPRLQRAG